MAEDKDSKTEQATPKKLSDARGSGQLAYSKELTGAIIFGSGILALKMSGEAVVDNLTRFITMMCKLPTEVFPDHDASQFLSDAMMHFLGVLLPVFAVGVASAVGPGFWQAGLNLTTKPLKPDPSKLNPIKGVKKIFSLNKVVEVVQNLVKITLVGIVVWVTISGAMPKILTLANERLSFTASLMLELIFLLGFRVTAGLLVIGFIDYLYKKWKFQQDMMMTKQEVKEERKSAEGDPKIKSKIKEIQRQQAINRMMNSVPTADVVVRNPTHFAVALRYDREADASPRVVAKGRGHIALKIIEIAKEAGVECVENKPLARELYRTVRLEEIIPERLFKAVAEILAMVFRKREARRAAAAR